MTENGRTSGVCRLRSNLTSSLRSCTKVSESVWTWAAQWNLLSVTADSKPNLQTWHLNISCVGFTTVNLWRRAGFDAPPRKTSSLPHKKIISFIYKNTPLVQLNTGSAKATYAPPPQSVKIFYNCTSKRLYAKQPHKQVHINSTLEAFTKRIIIRILYLKPYFNVLL